MSLVHASTSPVDASLVTNTSPAAGDLVVSDVWKGYPPGEPVLRGVSLAAPAGSLVAVLGLSGCGKTTLLRVIAGFERATRGSVRLGSVTLQDGRRHVAPERRGIGYVPQEGALFPNLSVRANVAFGVSRAQRRTGVVEELLEMVGIGPLARRMPHELSGGEQQRVALARALARRPAVLLLDEPFSSLDASLRATVREEVSALLRRQEATTVLVTHDQEEALSLADSVAVLRDGTIVQQGTPSELYGTPVDARLASFLGAANLLEATFGDGWAETMLGRLELSGEQDPTGGSAQGIVIVRPEQLRVSVDAAAASTPPPGAGVAGTVERCLYYGHDAVLHIRAVAQDTSLVARVGGMDALAAGTAVRVSARGPVGVVR
jgi:iron(III) transport system ATP-binding protein